ncbi:MAG: DUF2378 family protein [Myxococcota bacterium]
MSETTPVELVRPNFRAAFDPAQHLESVPTGGKVIGLYFRDVIDALLGAAPTNPRLAELVAVPYKPFRRYSISDWLELLALAAAEAHPDVPLREGLRRIGRSAYEAFIATMLGRTIFGIAGRDIDAAFKLGPKGFAAAYGGTNGGVRAEQPAPHTWHYTFRSYPAYLDTYVIGVMEGVVAHFGKAAKFRHTPGIFFDGVIEMVWSEP